MWHLGVLAQNKDKLNTEDPVLIIPHTVNLFESGGFEKILHIFAASKGILQILNLIFANSPFLCIIAIF